MHEGGPADRWSERFRARIAAAAVTRAGTPEELRRRELHLLRALLVISIGFAAVLTLMAAGGAMPWFMPAAMVLVAMSFARSARRARRRPTRPL